MTDLPPRFRVVTLCGSIKPLYSGVDDFDENLSQALRSRGLDMQVVDPGTWSLSQIGPLLRTVAEAKPDTILMQYPTEAFGRGLTPHIFSLLQRIAPLVVTMHEFTAVHPLRRLSTGPLLLRASAVVATAGRETKSLLRWYPWLRKRLRIIPIGATVPPRRWTPTAPPEVVYFGQIRPEKGLEDFLACHDRVIASLPGTKFAVIGSAVPKFAAYFDSFVPEVRRRNISLLTGLSATEVADRLATASVALLPFPGGASFRRSSLLSAAACELPIVTTTGIDTPADMASLLAPAATVDEMTALLIHALRTPDVLRAASERSRRLDDMAGWAAIADGYIDVFRAVAQSAPSPHAARLSDERIHEL